MPVISAICKPEQSEIIKVINGKINVKGKIIFKISLFYDNKIFFYNKIIINQTIFVGYAWSGGGRKIIRVDVTNDQGETWHTANLDAEDNNAKIGRYWSWTLWSVDLPVKKELKEMEIWTKAVDASYNIQPESIKNIWNLRGFLCNAYHKIKVKLEH